MATSISFAAITDYPFVPFTKIYSSDINNMFATIATPGAFTRLGANGALAAGTANYAIFNDASGLLTEAAQLPVGLGGLGTALLPGTVGQVIAVAPGGTSFQLSSSSGSSSSLYNFYNLS